MNINHFLVPLLITTICSISNGQNIISYTFGNGYPFEQNVANQTINCIAKQCMAGLKRSKFIDDNTYYDERLDHYLDSLNILFQTGRVKSLTPRMKPYYYIESTIPALTFYATFEDERSETIFFQIKLELAYQSGLLKAKRISLVDKDFIAYEGMESYRYEYDYEQGSKTNIPLPPPPPPPSYLPEVIPIYENEINLCSGCRIKHFISRDKKGNWLLNEKHQYQRLRLLGGGKIMARKNGKFGVIDFENNTIIPCIYDKIEAKSVWLYIVTQNGLQGVLDYKGDQVVPIIYSDVRLRTNSHFIIKDSDKMGIISKEGKLIIPIKYDLVELFYSKYWRVQKNGKYRLFDMAGNAISTKQYNSIDFESSLYSDRIIQFTTSKGKKMLAIIIEEDGTSKIKKVKLKKL